MRFWVILLTDRQTNEHGKTSTSSFVRFPHPIMDLRSENGPNYQPTGYHWATVHGSLATNYNYCNLMILKVRNITYTTRRATSSTTVHVILLHYHTASCYIIQPCKLQLYTAATICIKHELPTTTIGSQHSHGRGQHSQQLTTIPYLMRNFLNSVKSSHVIQCVNGWRQSTMKTKYLQIQPNLTKKNRN